MHRRPTRPATGATTNEPNAGRTLRYTAIRAGSALIVSLALLVGCGESKPCDGGGMVVDDSPLAGALKAGGGLPPSAVACRAEEEKPVDTRKSYELGANVDEGFETSQRHFVGSGWAQTSLVPDDVFRSAVFNKGNTDLTLRCSKRVEAKGWCNVTLVTKP